MECFGELPKRENKYKAPNMSKCLGDKLNETKHHNKISVFEGFFEMILNTEKQDEKMKCIDPKMDLTLNGS